MNRSGYTGVRLPVAGDMLCSLLALPTGLKWVYADASILKGLQEAGNASRGRVVGRTTRPRGTSALTQGEKE